MLQNVVGFVPLNDFECTANSINGKYIFNLKRQPIYKFRTVFVYKPHSEFHEHRTPKKLFNNNQRNKMRKRHKHRQTQTDTDKRKDKATNKCLNTVKHTAWGMEREQKRKKNTLNRKGDTKISATTNQQNDDNDN